MAMYRIERLRDNYEYPAARRVAFEDMCTLVYCEYLGLAGAVNRRVDQKGVEADPVVAVDPETGDRRWFAYQVKYFDDGTELRDRAGVFRTSIDDARELGADVLMLFVNKDLRDTEKENRFKAELEEYARRGEGRPAVRLDWWGRSRIETILAQPKYSHIPDRFLGSNIGALYKSVREQFFGDEGGELYGDVPLSECYIEPTVDVMGGDGANLTAREWVESFVDGKEKVAVLCGEPGHGKTSLCRKAVCDFYEGGWLGHKVHNVFCFSLNPANTDALDHASLDFYSLLSWGQNRRSERNKLEPEQCRGALVFLDGFDELLEWKPGLDLAVFIRDRVVNFQRATKSHVVITTRGMVVEPGASYLQVGRRDIAPVVRLLSITREQQLDWIEVYAQHLRGKLADNPESPSSDKRGEFETYAKQYGELDEDADFQKVLGVPIIFRMVVAARYLPKTGESITRMYDDLFDATWKRHDHGDADPSTDPCEVARARLSRHALRVYADDADTAVVDDILEAPWLFSFYTTHKGHMRVGFLHRSFYQHFLAHEVLSWFKRYADKENRKYGKKAFRNDLSYLARKRLDETTLANVREMHGDARDLGGLGAAFDKAYEILKETDGFLPLPKDERDAAQLNVVTPLERANNVFWNVVSICSMCGYALTTDKVNVFALQSYRLDGCHLEEARLCGVALTEVRLDGARLRSAGLVHADLGKAHLEGADLEGANLMHAQLEGAHLKEANLRDTDLEWANFWDAKLAGANLQRSYLQHAKFMERHLWEADFREAHFREAHFVI